MFSTRSSAPRANTAPQPLSASRSNNHQQPTQFNHRRRSHTPSPKRNALVLSPLSTHVIGPGTHTGGDLTDAIASAFLTGSLDEGEDSDEAENMADDETRTPHRWRKAPTVSRRRVPSPTSPAGRLHTVSPMYSPDLRARSRSPAVSTHSSRAGGNRDHNGSPRLLRI